MRTYTPLLLSLALIFAILPAVAMAEPWQPPTDVAPNANAPAPINVSASSQYKQGGFSIGRSNTNDLVGGINLFAPISKFLTLFAQTLNLSGTGVAGEIVLTAAGKIYATGATADICYTRGIVTKCLSAPSSGADNWGTQVVQHDTTLLGQGIVGNLLQVNPATVQARVGGTCAANNSIRTINQDGTVVCEPDDNSGGGGISSLTLQGTNGIGLRVGGIPAYPGLNTNEVTVASGNKIQVSMGVCIAGSLFQSIDTTPSDGIDNPTWQCVTPGSVIGGNAVTSVTAGALLRGFGVTAVTTGGDVVVRANPPSSGSGTTGNVLKWNGVAWVSGTEGVGPAPADLTGCTETGKVLKWNNTLVRWECGDDNSGSGGWALTGNAATNPPTNFIGTTDAQPLVVKTGNAERMRVGANGYVGIGTSNPQQKLHVSGNTGVRLRISDTAVASADWDILPQSGNTTKLFRIFDPTAGLDRMVINSSGNVGIGTLGGTIGTGGDRMVVADNTGLLSTRAIPSVGTTYTAGTGLTLTGTDFDLNNPSASEIGGVKSLTCSGTQKLSAIGADGTPVCTADVGGLTAEVDGVIGNEVTNATANKGLVRAGSGTALLPYTLGINFATNCTAGNQKLLYNGTTGAWSCGTDGGVPSGLLANYLPKWNGTALQNSFVHDELGGIGDRTEFLKTILTNEHAIINGALYVRNGADISNGADSITPRIFVTNLPTLATLPNQSLIIVDNANGAVRKIDPNLLIPSLPTVTYRVPVYLESEGSTASCYFNVDGIGGDRFRASSMADANLYSEIYSLCNTHLINNTNIGSADNATRQRAWARARFLQYMTFKLKKSSCVITQSLSATDFVVLTNQPNSPSTDRHYGSEIVLTCN